MEVQDKDPRSAYEEFARLLHRQEEENRRESVSNLMPPNTAVFIGGCLDGRRMLDPGLFTMEVPLMSSIHTFETSCVTPFEVTIQTHRYLRMEYKRRDSRYVVIAYVFSKLGCDDDLMELLVDNYMPKGGYNICNGPPPPSVSRPAFPREQVQKFKSSVEAMREEALNSTT